MNNGIMAQYQFHCSVQISTQNESQWN